MARLGRSFPATRFRYIRAALRTQSVIVVLGTEEGDGLLARIGLARIPTISTSEEISSTILSGVTVSTLAGSFFLSTTGLTTLLSGVQSSSTAGDGFSFTGLVTSGKWQQDKIKKNVPRRKWGRMFNFDNKNFEVGEDFVHVVDQYGQWRVSTITKDRFVLSSLQSISDNLGLQGKP